MVRFFGLFGSVRFKFYYCSVFSVWFGLWYQKTVKTEPAEYHNPSLDLTRPCPSNPLLSAWKIQTSPKSKSRLHYAIPPPLFFAPSPGQIDDRHLTYSCNPTPFASPYLLICQIVEIQPHDVALHSKGTNLIDSPFRCSLAISHSLILSDSLSFSLGVSNSSSFLSYSLLF